FGVNVSEKVAAQAVPVIGAAGGVVINVLFIDHFQEMARGHFIVRRLERTYDPQLVRAEYERLQCYQRTMRRSRSPIYPPINGPHRGDLCPVSDLACHVRKWRAGP